MAAYQPLFTSTGLILWNIMKTAQYIYTITIKQIVRLQERMHFEKIQLGGNYSLSHGRYLVNRARWLDHHYKTKCVISGEDASWKNSTWKNSKWPLIGHYSFSHGRYLVNRARWLDHYCKTKCEISDEDASWKNLTWSNLKWPPFRPLFIFTWLIFGKPC